MIDSLSCHENAENYKSETFHFQLLKTYREADNAKISVMAVSIQVVVLWLYSFYPNRYQVWAALGFAILQEFREDLLLKCSYILAPKNILLQYLVLWKEEETLMHKWI